MRRQSIRRALVAGTVLATAAIAQAGTTTDFSKLGPKHQARLAQMIARHQAITPQYNFDIKPAQLKKISVAAKVDASRRNAQIPVSLLAVDNLSGVDSIYVVLMSPTGQTVSGSWSSAYDTTRSEVQIGVNMSGVSDNGEWRVHSVSVSDANGNYTSYDEATLATMGRTTFTVTGADGDHAAPLPMTGGVNLTPTVSRSTPPRGMLPGSPARVAVQLKLADVGTSGLRSASIEYCLDGGYWDCFYLSGELSVRGQGEAMLTVGGHVYDWQQTGNYLPTSLYVYDHAGNNSYYYSSGGDDLNGLLDNPVITITE